MRTGSKESQSGTSVDDTSGRLLDNSGVTVGDCLVDTPVLGCWRGGGDRTAELYQVKAVPGAD